MMDQIQMLKESGNLIELTTEVLPLVNMNHQGPGHRPHRMGLELQEQVASTLVLMALVVQVFLTTEILTIRVDPGEVQVALGNMS